jgi:hypothetical protein
MSSLRSLINISIVSMTACDIIDIVRFLLWFITDEVTKYVRQQYEYKVHPHK